MPVRVKQRKLLVEQSGLKHQWNLLVSRVLALILACAQQVTLHMREDLCGYSVHLKRSAPVSQRIASHRTTLSLLIQASLIQDDSSRSWVPLSARTKELTVQGTVSIDPAPTRNVQFISLGQQPLFQRDGRNDLYEAINALFTASKFGLIYDAEAEINETEKDRRRQDKRYKCDVPTIKQIRYGQKGLNRWPMFCVRIDFHKEHDRKTLSRYDTADKKALLNSVLDILQKMFEQWLNMNDFGPLKVSHHRTRKLLGHSENSMADMMFKSEESLSPKEKSVQFSRIKRSRPESTSFPEISLRQKSTLILPTTARHSTSCNSLILPDAALSNRICNHGHCDAEVCGGETAHLQVVDTEAQSLDEFCVWTDPSTKRDFLLNSRNGTIHPVNEQSPPTSAVSKKICDTTKASMSTIQRNSIRFLGSKKRSKKGTTALDAVLDSWQNPVFSNLEEPLSCITHELADGLPMTIQDGEGSLGSARLSPEDLLDLEVIAQVENKFILAKTKKRQHFQEGHIVAEQSLLLLIDQHAADERCKVEALYNDLCSPYGTSELILQSNIGMVPKYRSTALQERISFTVNKTEGDQLCAQASHFAHWGILFDHLTKTQHAFETKIEVFALPPAIAERCAAEPKALIDMMRSEAWQRIGKPTRTASTADNTYRTVHPWLRHIGTCPRGIIDMLNSRACRSAVMFNDHLSTQECEELIQRLAGCALPFQCAHGRPSMVPLVDMSRLKMGVDTPHRGIQSAIGELAESDQTCSKFVAAYKSWRNYK